MSQPRAIYASIPSTSPLGPNWLSTSPNLLPLTVANPFPTWPNLDWSVDGIMPSIYSAETPDYLWNPAIADVSDGTLKQFTRRLEVGGPASPVSARLIQEGNYRFVLSVAADDEYLVRLLHNGMPIEGPDPGFNFAVPTSLPWRNVKTFVYGATGAGITLLFEDTLDIQIQVRNIPQAVGSFNPAMFTWILQIFAI